MKKDETTNSFDGGLIMDLNPLVTPNNVLTNALNATLITFNGNEYILLNDMGNGRVETAYLPEGYIPLGTTELGGIIYIVSYNPLIGKCLIGSFPSPERNITTDELGETEKILDTLEFYDSNGMIATPSKKLILLDKELNPGDKFLIYCELLESVNYISAKLAGNYNPDAYPRYLKFNVVLVLDDGTITNLNDTLVWLDNNYYILSDKITSTNGKIDLDEYRNLINSNYNVVISNVSGKLAILAELEVIEQFDVTWDAVKVDDLWNIYLFLNWNYDNESSQDKINLYAVRVDCDAAVNTTNEVVIYDYPKSSGIGVDNDIMNNLDTTFYTPYYVDAAPYNDEVPDYSTNGGITTARYNNGSDNLFLLTTPIVLNEDAEGIVEFTVYPGMPFGYLAYLATTFSIDISKLGTGEIDLIEYRYYWNSDNITLNWGLDAYPERNKKIQSVTFEFYEFTLEIYDWICSNYINVDYNRGVYNTDETPTWEEPDEDSTEAISSGDINFPSVDPYYTHVVSNQSSYSGNFTESINKLENYSLYLVKIIINYNDEKYIEYYRFMYTSNLFNDYYYSSEINNDYRNIVLEDAILTYRPYIFGYTDFKLSVVNNDYQLLEVNGSTETAVDSIEPFILTTTEEEQTYKATYEYSNHFSFTLTGNVNDNSTFIVDFADVNITVNNTDVQITNTSSQTSLTNSGISSSISTIDDISYNNLDITSTVDGNTCSSVIMLQFVAPILVRYSNLTTLSVDYTFLPLDYITLWLLHSGGHDSGHWLFASREYISVTKDELDSYDHWGDDTQITNTFSGYPIAYEEVQNYLDSHDVVVIKFATHRNTTQGSQGAYTIVGKGDRTGSGGDAALTYERSYGIGSSESGEGRDTAGIILLYAISSNNDDATLFTYGKSGTYASSWYGLSFSGQLIQDTFPSSYIYKPFAVEYQLVETDDEYAASPMLRYYKFASSSDVLNVMLWSTVTYWDDYTWTITIPFNISCTITLSINGVALENTDSHPNNLRYEPELNFTVNIDLTGNISYSNYIDELTTTGKSLYYNTVTDTYEYDAIQPGLVYDENMNIISYLKQDNGDSSIGLNELDNSKHSIRIKDDKLLVTVGSGYSANQLTSVMSRLEELNITITKIIQINDVT